MSSITDFFAESWEYCRQSPTPSVPLEEGAFPAMLDIDISSDTFEIPTVLYAHVAYAKQHGCDRLVFNLINGGDNLGRRTLHKKTVSTILRQFNDASRTSMRIAHIVTSKNIHYYGCKGMIFNGDYRPLMLATSQCTYNPVTELCSITDDKLRLDYKVFENATEIIEKTIIKQAIPYFSQGSRSIDIVISDLSNWVIKPNKPTMLTSLPGIFNDTIANTL